MHDAVVFGESAFRRALLEERLDLQPETFLPSIAISVDHYMVGDQAFPLHRRIMRPYPGNFLDERKRIFNYRLSRARRTIENTFGILV